MQLSKKVLQQPSGNLMKVLQQLSGIPKKELRQLSGILMKVQKMTLERLHPELTAGLSILRVRSSEPPEE